jgi:hypothetical protein
MATTPPSPRLPLPPKTPQFPPHNAPRVWFMTDGMAPIAIALSRHLLEHGDYVVAGTLPSDFESTRGEGLRSFMGEVARQGVGNADEDEVMESSVEDMELGGEKEDEPREEDKDGRGGSGQRSRRKRWRDRFRVVRLDGR